MFVSFFPRPFALTISAILWGAIAVSFWYMFGSQTGELLGFHLQPPPKVRRSRRLLVNAIPLVLSLFWRDGRRVRVDLDAVVPSPLVTLVDPWIGVDFVHLLFPGTGQRRGQRLVRAIL